MGSASVSVSSRPAASTVRTSDPSNVGHAGVLVSGVDVENVLDSQGRSEKVTTLRKYTRGTDRTSAQVRRMTSSQKGRTHGGVDDSLGLSGRPTGVEDEERILGAHDLDGADGRDLGALLVPPRISTLGPSDLAARSLEDEDVLDQGALLERGVDDGLGRDRLSSSLALTARSQQEPSGQHDRRWSRDGGEYALGSDDDLALAVDASVPERLGREPGEDDRVDGTDPRASQEGSRCLPGHGKIDRNLSSGEFQEKSASGVWVSEGEGEGRTASPFLTPHDLRTLATRETSRRSSA
jgi:hypothetical protein